MTLRGAGGAIGTSTPRVDGALKVAGTAPYAYEHRVPDPAYLAVATATVARGTVRRVDAARAEAVDGVLKILTPFDAPTLSSEAEGEYSVLQSPRVRYRGEIVAAVLAETSEIARSAADLLDIEYLAEDHDVAFRHDHPGMYTPEEANGGFPPDTVRGDADRASDAADVVLDRWYSTPENHNNPLEPHTTVALWTDRPDADVLLTLYDSTQHPRGVSSALAPLFGLEQSQVRVICPYIGGGFGSKGAPHAHDVIAAMAARTVPGRAVRFAVPRTDMFAYVGYRAPTISHVRLGATKDGIIDAVVHEAYTQSSHVAEFVEQAGVPARSMYAVPHLRTSHRAVTLDVPAPFWMRAPGEAPGMYALEVAMDELADACGIDPIELRIRNEPAHDPESGKPWSSRRLVDCLRRGADTFGWDAEERRNGSRRQGRVLRGTGVAAATYPHMVNPGCEASVRYDGKGRYTVAIAAADLGTGAWTALTLIAADALRCGADQVTLEIGDSALPEASVAGGSTGTSSWGAAIVAAGKEFRARYGSDPGVGARVVAAAEEHADLEDYKAQSFGAHFVEAEVDVDTGEIRIPRMLGVFSVGRVINPRTVRSQFIGGMCFGISMALFEESVRDGRFGHIVNHDLAEYHIPTHADIRDVDAMWLDEVDEHATPTGSRGAGEIGIVGSAAAVVNAICHATGVRVRDLPVRLDDVLGALP